jgi:UDP-N-acetylmuramyl pentapeptide phosphotransferase/UDP-N-acetylglucosamine-1-phosphate transferase
MLLVLLLAFAATVVGTLLVIRVARVHGRMTDEFRTSGPQRLHAHSVPRIGGIGIFVGFSVGVAVLSTRSAGVAWPAWAMLLCSLPAFVVGLHEDCTNAVSARRRLLATAVSGALGVWLLDASIERTDIPGLEFVVSFPLGAFLVTLFMVAGVSNSVNIIDGMNGLASMCSAIMLSGLAYVGVQVGDMLVAGLALAAVGASLGFFLWNYPRGLVFLGDGGAYFLGFVLVELSILLVHRNPDVSPIFPVLLCAYPIFETMFSMYRRKFVRGRAMGLPDGIHLHTLIYRRLMRWAVGKKDAEVLVRRNSMTSPYLWLLCSLSAAPAVLWWDSTRILAAFIALFVLSYIFLYRSIVRFNTPRILVIHR